LNGEGPWRRANGIAARENNQIGVTKVRVIESVEDLRPKLQIHLLFQRNPFEQRRIHVPHTRSPQLVAPRIAKGPAGWRQESIGIEISAGFLNPSTPRMTLPLKLEFKLGTSGLRLSPFPDRLEPTVAVNGKPPVALKIAFHCQPPISFSTRPLAPLPNALPFPKGNW